LLKPGRVVAGRYRLVAPIGEGAMGTVWRASDTETEAACALKFLRPEAAAQAKLRLRFLREGLVASRLRHPGLVDVYDAGEHDGSIFVTFELLEGASLASVLGADQPPPLRLFLRWMAELADTLCTTHAAGVIHRDLKPANLFVHRASPLASASLRVLDFGVSKVAFADDGLRTRTGSFVGTPRYVAPEQIHSAATVDARADLWSMGAIMFVALTGVFAHDATDLAKLMLAIANEPPRSIDAVRPDLPAPVRALVRDLLKPRPHRIKTAEVVRARLGEALDGATVARDLRLPGRDAATPAEAIELPDTVATPKEAWATAPGRPTHSE